MIKDTHIRKHLFQTILRQYQGQKDVMIIEELGLCQGISRIDIAVVNGSLIGFEIKSEKDTLKRLQGQQDIYNKTLDYVYMVAHTNHIKGVRSVIPKWWGIIEVSRDSKKIASKILRQPKKNKAIDGYSIAQLLWKDEALAILEEHNMASGIRSKPRTILWEKLANEFSTSMLSEIVRNKIRTRGDWRVDLLHK